MRAVADARSLRTYHSQLVASAEMRLVGLTLSSLVEPRTVVRIRVRRNVVRIRVGETAISVRVVVRTTDNTAVRLFRTAKVGIFMKHQTLQAEKFSFPCSFLLFGQRKREQPFGSPSNAFSKFALCA